MKRHRHIAPFLLSFAMLAGSTAVPASAGPLSDLRAAHERHKQQIRAAHQRHVRAVERAHARHVRHAPAPIRKLDRVVQERHQAHRAHVRGAEDIVAQRRSAHRANVAQVRNGLHSSGPVQFVESRHAAHAQALGSVGASVEKAHRRNVSALQRFADWLVGA